MKKLVIFGAGDIAQLAHFYFSTDSRYEVAGFVVDDEYCTSDQAFGLPLVPFSRVTERFSPNEHDAFVAVSYARMNRVREEKYMAMKEVGYTITSYISSRCTCLTKDMGENCFILEDNTIQPFVRIGNNVTLWSGNHIGHHSTIEDNVFIASHVVVSGGVRVERNCFIGVNATIRDHVVIGTATLIGAGVLITKSTDPESVYRGPKADPMPIKSSSLKSI